MFNLLNAIFDASNLKGSDWDYLVPIVEFLNKAVVPITIVLLVGAAILAVCIGIALAKAEGGEKAAEMKKRLWGLMIAVVIITALIWALGYILSNYGTIMTAIREAFTPKK